MKVFFGLLAAVLLLAACEKDKYETKPKISVKSVSTDIVPIGGNLNVSVEFTDQEGDVDSTITLIRQRLNRRDFTARPLSDQFRIPQFPDKKSGEIAMNLQWATHLTLRNPPLRIPGQNRNEPDTLRLSFIVKDAKGNISDTAHLSQNIIVIR